MEDIENSYWAGQRIGDMTREELIAALRQATVIMRSEEDNHKRTLDAWSRFIAARNLPRH